MGGSRVLIASVSKFYFKLRAIIKKYVNKPFKIADRLRKC
ncbi:hypothetical protein V4_2455 [Lactococcus cremoris]|nr:hypothetical protein V4_2455 [Lactococcus cremoris]